MTEVQKQLQGNNYPAKYPYAMILNSSVIQWSVVIPLERKKWRWRPEPHDANFTAQIKILTHRTEQ